MKKLGALFDKFALKIGVILALIFIPLYPKLPSIQVTHTWVYIRLEDFLIALLGAVLLVQLVRKKASLLLPIGFPIIIYWIIGLVSTLVSIIFIGPHLANFFPKIAFFEYVRRIEYMFLFFVAFFSVRSFKDIRDYMIALTVAMVGIVLYGLGQHFYLSIWAVFPKFFEHFSFCFPSFQTGNEEFAKGVPLCLPGDARDTSTFGGHYDLAAYLVIVIPLLISLMFVIKRKFAQIGLGMLSLGSIALLIFTSSRVSFVAYLLGVTASLIFLKRKKFIIPVVLISVLLLVSFSGSLAKRFLETVRFTSVVTNTQGQVVGVTTTSLPTDLQSKISKNPITVEAPPPSQNLPTGSSFITLPQAPVATSVAVVQSSLGQKEAERLKLQYGGLEISTVSGSFLIQKALVYDISFTTRFQSEWPRDWQAFMSEPPLGTGYSSLTLASDNDYLRLLGETGFLGFTSFLLIFIIFGIFLKEMVKEVDNKFAIGVAYGIAGGILGLAFNALMIDVFESSKVAESLWILLGIGAAGIALQHQKHINYIKQLISVFTSNFFNCVYLLLVIMIFFMKSVTNFFVADDFTWLRWAAQSTFHDIPQYFLNAQGFFYRPIDKTIMLGLYTFFSFMPAGYHIFNILLHVLITWSVYFLVKKITNHKLWAILAAFLFAILPSHGENLFWISTLSNNLATLFMLLSVTCYLSVKQRFGKTKYLLSIVWGILAFLSYEMAAALPILLLATNIFYGQVTSLKKQFMRIVPFIVLDIVYVIVRKYAHVVAAGGDYAYNLTHLVQNFVGNTVGYLAFFFFGEGALPYYTFLRTQTKSFSIIFGIVAALLVLGVGSFVYKKRITLFKHSSTKLFIFGLVFIVCALLPFLGLGNLTERYGYLASVGFVISIVSLMQLVLSKINKKTLVLYGGIILVLVYAVWCYISLSNTLSQWDKAGRITYNTLGYFKIEQDDVTPTTALYFVNVPIRKENAWIFPVGLSDGLWFVYRNDAQQVHTFTSITEAKATAGNAQNVRIFVFDANGNISQIK